MRHSSPMPLRLSLALAAALTFGAAAPALAATGDGGHGPGPGRAAPGLDRAALREAITVRPEDGTAGVLARVYRDGETWRGTSGDVVTGQRLSRDAHFRIGSISKPMEAVILLQLSAEGRVDLDRSVQDHLPGLLAENLFKEPVTVRQLLDHTSGLPQEFEGAPASTSPDEDIRRRLDYVTFDEVIRLTLHPEGRRTPGPRFSPGTRQEYNSFGYRVAGKLIEEITGHSFQHEVRTRILDPLKMRETRASVTGGSTPVPRPYLPGYQPRSDGRLVDVNVQGGLPASMTSTTGDLDRFIRGLFDGRLLGPAQTAELFAIPKGPDGKPLPYVGSSHCTTGPARGTACFSVGLMYAPLPDGSVLWGKTGSDMGYRSAVFATRDLNLRAVYATGTSGPPGDGAPAVAQRLIGSLFAR
ncbi:serine hydrolase domain-containing protein [Streptomyces flavochromogenes]|uniref:serine hydrolase domain-containing protein n=1 Tax=Streptomyces flavochromogenes TaxID=68199 RepID=UPI0004BEB7B7|nr:serine hydrolase domain-containing protein [Streptomyces flavochromogenes]